MNLFQKLERPKLETENIKVLTCLFPKKMIYENKLYRITSFNRKYHINSYTIKVINNKLEELYIEGYHPNAKPKNNEFCIPHTIMGVDYSELEDNVIENILTTFNIDYCYYTPWGEIEFKEI